MDKNQLTKAQENFADIIWDNAPINSGKLVELCKKEFEWQKSTTYTMLKKLCTKGIFKVEDATVYTLKSKAEFLKARSVELVSNNFNGSLPKFLTAFFSDKPLSKADAKEIRDLIDQYTENE